MSIHLPKLSNHHTVSNFNTQGAQKKTPLQALVSHFRSNSVKNMFPPSKSALNQGNYGKLGDGTQYTKQQLNNATQAWRDLNNQTRNSVRDQRADMRYEGNKKIATGVGAIGLGSGLSAASGAAMTAPGAQIGAGLGIGAGIGAMAVGGAAVGFGAALRHDAHYVHKDTKSDFITNHIKNQQNT